MNSTTPQTPFLGVAYYPEAWDEAEISHDIDMMKKAGIRCVRMAEFAWSMMEPEPDCFSFAWLHRVIDRLAEAGIFVVLGTPTATPPIWLSQMDPEVMVLGPQHIRMRHGGRRHCCSNHPLYRARSLRIVEAMAKEFGADPQVIGWQIDNEINAADCRCDFCLRGFRQFLRKKYGTIDALNRAWNTRLFSQTYKDFDQIPLPEYGWHNPHIRLERILFDSATQSDFVGAQIDLLKRYTSAPIGTDTMPVNRIDYETLTAKCDIMQYNHYDRPQDLHIQRFWFDFIRPQKPLPFWNTETSACWNGSDQTEQSVRPYGFCRINSWLPVAFGGDANMYWLWRTHRAGHEMTHGALLSACGRPLHIFDEVRRVADEFAKCAPFLCGTRVVSQVGVHFTSLAWNMWETQPQVKGFVYAPALYDRIYAPIAAAGIRPDVIGAKKDLCGYKLLFSCLLPCLEEGDLPARIEAWVRAGGVWVVGPMTDIRNACGAQYTHAPYGMLEHLTGARQAYECPDREGQIVCRWADGTPFAGGTHYELFEPDPDGLAAVSEGYPTLIGKSVLLRKKVGRGVVYLLGTLPSAADMQKIVAMAARDAGVATLHTEGKVAVVPREGEAGRGLIVLECAGEEGAVDIGQTMTDMLTGKAYAGRVVLAPYDLLVLRAE